LFSYKWAEFIESKRFETLERLPRPKGLEAACVGLMGVAPPDIFEYWIGMFCAEDAPVPAGFDAVELPAMEAGVCWVQGTEPEIYTMHEHCAAALLENEMALPRQGGRWLAFERYNCPRYTQPDAQGRRILDYGIYLA
jgi:hypothetical protein